MDPMILQQIKKMGISEKRELLERLKALIAKKMAGSALSGVPKVQIAQFLLQGPRRVWPPEMEVLLVRQDLLCKDKICPGYVQAYSHHMGRICKGHAWQV